MKYFLDTWLQLLQQSLVNDVQISSWLSRQIWPAVMAQKGRLGETSTDSQTSLNSCAPPHWWHLHRHITGAFAPESSAGFRHRVDVWLPPTITEFAFLDAAALGTKRTSSVLLRPCGFLPLSLSHFSAASESFLCATDAVRLLQSFIASIMPIPLIPNQPLMCY